MFDCIKSLFSFMDPFYKVTKEDDNIILTPKDENYHINSVLIFLHGLGDTAESYVSTFQSSSRPVPKTTKVILPTAPIIPMTMSAGMEMHSWYDIKGFTSETDVSEEDVMNNTKKIIKMIHKEAKLLEGKYDQIFVGGFSQGACIALSAGLNCKENIGGVVALSGVLFPFCTKDVDVKKKKELFMYLGHGSNDEVINVNLAKMSYEYFTTNKFDNVKYTEFEMGHTICAQELNEVNDFIYMNAIKHYI